MKLGVEIADKVAVPYDDAVFYVRPITVDEFFFLRHELFKKYPEFKKKGIDTIPEELQPSFVTILLKKAIVGWENIEDKNGKVPCTEKTIPRVLTVIVKNREIIDRLVEVALSLINSLEEEGKKID